MDPSLAIITAWPALLSHDEAARYLSVEVSTFRRLARLHAVVPVYISETDVRWTRADLDRMIKKLESDTSYGAHGQTTRPLRLEPSAISEIAEQVAALLSERTTPQSRGTMLSINEACDALGVGRSTVYRLLETGELTKKKIGRRSLISRTDIEKLLDQ